MDHIRLHPGDVGLAIADINKTSPRSITINEGPVESVLKEPLGPILLDATRLYGRVWVSGPEVVIRYYAAHPPDAGRTIPICAAAALIADEHGGKQRPGPAPGSVILDHNLAAVYVVDEFR